MSQTQNNLDNNYGLANSITPQYSIAYDDSLSAADGLNRANALIGACEVHLKPARQHSGRRKKTALSTEGGDCVRHMAALVKSATF